MKNAWFFLELVTKRWPPLFRQSHSLVLHKGKLQLNLIVGAPCQKFVFDPTDLEKDPEALLREVAALMPKDGPVPAA